MSISDSRGGDNEGKPHWVREHWLLVTIGSTLSAALSAVGLNAAYVDWHDDRYIKRVEAMTIAAADNLSTRVDQAIAQGTDNSAKLDFLLIQAAEREVYDAQIALLEIEKNAQPTLQYHDIKRDATLRLKSAEALLVCFRAGRVDCRKPGAF